MSFLCPQPSTPVPPDYAAAAQATAAGNLEATKYATQANRVNQVTPYGNLTYSRSPDTFDQAGYDAAMAKYNAQVGNNSSGNGFIGAAGRAAGLNGLNGASSAAPTKEQFTTMGNDWTATQTLAPEQQALLDKNNQLSLGLMDTANKGLGYANDVLSHPGIDQSQLPSTGINPGQSYQDAMMARISPQIDRENQQSDAQLANQGITQGSEAYNNAKTLLNQSHNDLRNNATVQGMQTGLQANNQAFNQAGYNQMQPINVINALRTGSQVSSPNFVNPAQQQTTQGADYLGAANSQAQYNQGLYNAQVGAQNSMTSGLFGLGAAALSASDKRLKKNIVRIGTHALNIGIYVYDYIWGERSIGVMAQDVAKVKPEAVVIHPSGYLMVNYGAL